MNLLVKSLCALALFASVVLSAAEQYSYGWNYHLDGYSVKATYKNGYYIDVLTDTSLSFTTDLSSTTPHIIKRFTDTPALFAEVGYYVEKNGVVGEKNTLDFVNSDVATINVLEAGDKVGFYVTDLNGNTTYSTKTGSDYFEDGAFANKVFNGRDSYQFNKETNDWEKRLFTFSYGDQKVELGVLLATGSPVYGGGEAPSGQPLPGAAVMLFCAGIGAVAMRKIRRR